jgi:hypothetical protein
MSLETLFAWLEARDVTPVTASAIADVTPEPSQMLGCTAVTPVTAESIIAAIQCPLAASDMRDLYEERAAILEYDGGLSRTEAEWLANDFVKNFRGQQHGRCW